MGNFTQGGEAKFHVEESILGTKENDKDKSNDKYGWRYQRETIAFQINHPLFKLPVALCYKKQGVSKINILGILGPNLWESLRKGGNFCIILH